MSPADLIAYLLAVEPADSDLTPTLRGGPADQFPVEGITWNELGLLAHRSYAEHAA